MNSTFRNKSKFLSFVFIHQKPNALKMLFFTYKSVISAPKTLKQSLNVIMSISLIRPGLGVSKIDFPPRNKMCVPPCYRLYLTCESRFTCSWTLVQFVSSRKCRLLAGFLSSSLNQWSRLSSFFVIFKIPCPCVFGGKDHPNQLLQKAILKWSVCAGWGAFCRRRHLLSVCLHSRCD